MSKPMNRIEKLIAELCPDGVEFRELGEVCKVLRGSRLTKKELSNEYQYPVFHGGLIPLGYYYKYNRKANQTMIINTGSIGEVVWSPVDFWSSDGTFTIETSKNISDKFIYFFLKTQETYLKSQKREGGVPTIDRDTIKKIKIPLPPLAIQEEIVKILDTFTQLEAELEAELEARKKQYEYYRNELLRPKMINGKWLLNGKEMEWKELGEVCLPTNNIKWKESKKSYRYIDLASVSRENHVITETIEINAENAPSRAQKIVKKDDVIFATTRPTLQRFTIIDNNYDGEIVSTGFCVLRADTTQVLPKWIYYSIYTSTFNNYVEKNQEGSAYPSISDEKIKALKIPIPSLSEQERIVAILDKFDALVNDLSVGLPAELNARRKQYEYYRNKLLTFKPLGKEYA